MSIAEFFGKVFVSYFLVYPVIYFVYNWFIQEINYIQYQIPGFWVGMAGFFLIIVTKNILFKRKPK
jgi:drug/metabolite transporter superfamily protein YnfA